MDTGKLVSRISAAVIEGNVGNLEKALTDPAFESSMLEQTNAQGISPFRLSARSGSAQIVDLLMDYSAETSQDVQPFFLAASWGNTGALRVMISRGTNVNIIGSGKQTPLVAAVKAGRLQAAQELILASAQLDVEDSKKNTPLSIAWANNDLEMVRCLVKHGADVELSRWISAPSSGANMCLHLVEGVAMRISADPTGVDAVPELPASALPGWILLAPEGASILLDTILVKEIKSSAVPPRAELKGGKTMIAVCAPLREFDASEPIFSILIPKDTGRGTQVKVSMLVIRGILTGSVLQAISLCPQPTKILCAHAVKGILTVLWDFHVRDVFFVDLAFEVINMITFGMWTGFVAEGFQSSSYTQSKLLSLALLFIVVVREIMHQFGNVSFAARTLNQSFFSRRSFRSLEIVSAIDIVVSILLIMTAGIFTLAFEHAAYDYFNPPKYLTVLSFVAFLRWVRIVNYFCSFQSVGSKILPIVRCFSSIGAFLGVFLLVLFFLLHGTYVFYFPDERFGSIIDFFMRQYFLGMVSRWPIFLRSLEKDGLFLHNPTSPRGQWVDELDVKQNAFFGFTKQCTEVIRSKTPTTEFIRANRLESEFYPVIIFWYVASALLIGIVMLQIFVGVLSQAYANEKQRAHISFAKRRSEVSCTYFLNRTIQPDGWKAFNIFRMLIGRVKTPVKDGFIWICSKAESLTDSSEDIVETSKKKEHAFEQMCKQLAEFAGERAERVRLLTAMMERLETRLDYMVSRNDACARERSHSIDGTSLLVGAAKKKSISSADSVEEDDDEDEDDGEQNARLARRASSADFNILQAMAGGRRTSK